MRFYEYKDDSLDTTPKAQSVKDFIKIKHFRSAKDNVKKMSRKATDLEKILVEDTSDKGLLSKIYKEHLKSNSKTNNSVEKQALTDTSTKKTYR